MIAVGEFVWPQASGMLGVSLATMDANIRRRTTAINFGIIYGIGAFGLGQQIGVPQAEAGASPRMPAAGWASQEGIAAPASKWKAAGRKRGDLLQFSGRPTASVRRSGQGQTPRAPLREPGSAFLVLLRSWMLGVEQVRIDENRRSGEPSPCSMSSATLSGESPGLRSPRSRAVILKACGWAVTRRLASPRRGISLTISRRGWSARRASALSLVATSSSRVSVVLTP
jgi:hypothetical protein